MIIDAFLREDVELAPGVIVREGTCVAILDFTSEEDPTRVRLHKHSPPTFVKIPKNKLLISPIDDLDWIELGLIGYLEGIRA